MHLFPRSGPASTNSRQILDLRARGYENDDIAQLLRITSTRVQGALDRSAKLVVDTERATRVREAELLKIDEMEAVVYCHAVPEDDNLHMLRDTIEAQKQVLKLMERRAALLGVDKQAAQTNPNGLTLVQILADMPPVIDMTPDHE